MATEIPEARGFAAALERHLANGGGMRKSGNDRRAGAVFTKGRARGLTMEEATAQARDMWDRAPDSVKEKYSRSGGVGLLAPSERPRMAAAVERPGMGGGVQLPDGRTYVPGRGIDVGNGVFQQVSMPQYEAGGRPVAGRPAYGNRPDGTPKGKGWLGELKLPNGSVATEYTMQSRAVTKDGKQIDFPTLVPGLTPEEVKLMTEDIIPNGRDIPEHIIQKAIQHANGRISAGQSVFAEEAAQNSRVAGIERPPQVHTTGMPGPWKVPTGVQPNGGAPSRSQAIAAGAVSRPSGPRINRLTGKPFGYHPSDDAAPSAPTYAGPKPGAGRYDPDIGFVPSAVPVAEKPMTQDEYTATGTAIKETIEPGSPEMSAALGRRRTFEDEQMKAKAVAMQRERLGPSFAERDATDRAARRKLDQRVMATYGRAS